MTDEQMDDLMTLAVNMQREAETDCNRPSAMFAYAVQVAVLEIRETHSKYEELQSQNADLAVQLANAESKCRELAAENAGLKAACDDRRTFIMNGVQLGYIQVPTVETDPALETIRTAVSPQAPTPATNAFLDEVRAQSASELIAAFSKHVSASCLNDSSVVTIRECEDAMQHVAAQLKMERG